MVDNLEITGKYTFRPPFLRKQWFFGKEHPIDEKYNLVIIAKLLCETLVTSQAKHMVLDDC